MTFPGSPPSWSLLGCFSSRSRGTSSARGRSQDVFLDWDVERLWRMLERKVSLQDPRRSSTRAPMDTGVELVASKVQRHDYMTSCELGRGNRATEDWQRSCLVH